MTGQINDLFQYLGNEYSLVGYSVEDAFDPRSLGMNPTGLDTACWRGYQVTYALAGAQLLVFSLGVNLVIEAEDYERVEGPVIDGVKPVEDPPGYDGFNNNYLDLRLALRYSGGILLGDEFVDEFYEHMGFQDAWKYRKLLELNFNKGQLVDTIDLSEEAAEIQAIAWKQRVSNQKFVKEMSAARQASREDLFDEIRDRHRPNIETSDTADTYEDLIREQIRQAFSRYYTDE